MERDEILTTLRQESDARKKSNHQLQIAWGIIFALILVAFFVQFFRGKDVGSDYLTYLGFLPLIGITFGLTPRAKSAVVAAAKSGDPEVVKYLVESLDSGDQQIYALVKPSLAEILPIAPRQSLTSLDSHHRVLLRRAIITRDPILGVAAVKTLASLGDRDSVSILENLRDSQSAPKLLKDAVTHALPDLRIQMARIVIDKKVEEVGQQQKA